jgi:predicted RNA-binding Zn-ribbon protein involved in translation (DUF1610 family)
MDASFGEPIRLTIGSLSARCPNCGTDEFVGRVPAPRTYSEVLVCVACHIETPRWKLVDQIAREVERRAQEVLGKEPQQNEPSPR